MYLYSARNLQSLELGQIMVNTQYFLIGHQQSTNVESFYFKTTIPNIQDVKKENSSCSAWEIC